MKWLECFRNCFLVYIVALAVCVVSDDAEMAYNLKLSYAINMQ